MNLTKYVTRTITTINCNCTLLDKDTKTVYEQEVEVPAKKYTQTSLERAIQATLPTNIKLVNIDATEMKHTLRGMLLTDFIANSNILDATENTETDEN